MQTSVRAKELEKMYFISIEIKAELIKVQKSIKYQESKQIKKESALEVY